MIRIGNNSFVKNRTKVWSYVNKSLCEVLFQLRCYILHFINLLRYIILKIDFYISIIYIIKR